MPPRRPRTPRPLDEARLRELALSYVGRFATTRGKLRDYLRRKIGERGWEGASEPDLARLADEFASQGYIDDAGFALAKAQALCGRGYGKRRLAQTLQTAGVEAADAVVAHDHADHEAVAAALRFAQRRRIGPFRAAPSHDRKEQEKAIAAMIRAGHPFALARAIALMPPGEEADFEILNEKVGRTQG